MNVVVYLYPTVTLFEMTIAAYFLRTKFDVTYVASAPASFESYEGIPLSPQTKLSEMNPTDIDALIIPGGEIYGNLDCQHIGELKETIRLLDSEGKVLCGICSGKELIEETLHIANSDKHTTVLDNRIILSPPCEYVDFAIAIGKALNVFEDEYDLAETINFFKYFIC